MLGMLLHSHHAMMVIAYVRTRDARPMRSVARALSTYLATEADSISKLLLRLSGCCSGRCMLRCLKVRVEQMDGWMVGGW